jgi:hypothetical protein
VREGKTGTKSATTLSLEGERAEKVKEVGGGAFVGAVVDLSHFFGDDTLARSIVKKEENTEPLFCRTPAAISQTLQLRREL